MKIFVMTDLEGVAGGLDYDHWLEPGQLFHETGRRLLTEEVNAALRGFAMNGFDELVVCDGHGAGSIDIERLEPQAKLLRGCPTQFGPYTCWPFGLDSSFDALAFVGQHAKAGTPWSQLPHTGNMNMLDIAVNGVSVGEYGELALCAGERGVPVIFAAGEKALCLEAAALTPWVVTAAVKEGNIPGDGADLPTEEYCRSHQGALHLQPAMARRLIFARAAEAARRFNQNREAFRPLRLAPPYRAVSSLRPAAGRPEAVTVEAEDGELVSTALNKVKAKVEEVFRRPKPRQ